MPLYGLTATCIPDYCTNMGKVVNRFGVPQWIITYYEFITAILKTLPS